MKLDIFLQESRKILDLHNLTTWNIKISSSKSVFGMCRFNKKTINISKYLILLESDENKIWDTLLHEIAHALDIYKRTFSNHDATWKEIALSIGCNGMIYGDYDTFKVDVETLYKYKGICQNCNSIIYKDRIHINRHNIKCNCEDSKIIFNINEHKIQEYEK